MNYIYRYYRKNDGDLYDRERHEYLEVLYEENHGDFYYIHVKNGGYRMVKKSEIEERR